MVFQKNTNACLPPYCNKHMYSSVAPCSVQCLLLTCLWVYTACAHLKGRGTRSAGSSRRRWTRSSGAGCCSGQTPADRGYLTHVKITMRKYFHFPEGKFFCKKCESKIYGYCSKEMSAFHIHLLYMYCTYNKCAV